MPETTAPHDTDPTTCDVVVIGTGSGGKMVAQELARAGRSVVVVEAERVGGYCPYLACVPAKSMLISAHSGLSLERAVEVRDEASSHRDDTGAAAGLEEDGGRVLRGRGRLLSATSVHVDLHGGGTARVDAGAVVLGTGSHPVAPPVEGLDDVPTWTSEQALAATEHPQRLLVLGGGAVACESAQAYAGLGVDVVLVQRSEHLLSSEEPWVGELLAEVLREDGVEVRTGVTAERVERIERGPGSAGARLHLSDGTSVEADRVLVAGGRKPTTDGLGVEEAGGALEESGGIAVDERCRVLSPSGEVVEGLFAVGDVTAISPYTHTANHQARVVVSALSGGRRTADYRAIPRAVYTDPVVFCVGLTEAQAADAGTEVVTASFDVGEVERAALVRLSTGMRTTGRVSLVADAATGVLLGASCVGPEADSWGAELSLAVKARLDVDLLEDHVRAFPTWSEAIYPALCTLKDALPGS